MASYFYDPSLPSSSAYPYQYTQVFNTYSNPGMIQHIQPYQYQHPNLIRYPHVRVHEYSSNGGMIAEFSDGMTITIDENGEIIDDYSQFDRDRNKMKQDQLSSEETILKHLKTRVNNKSEGSSESEEAEICVICQEVYEDGERIGKVECGHEYHVDCIKKWLLQSTFCPICKTTALPS